MMSGNTFYHMSVQRGRGGAWHRAKGNWNLGQFRAVMVLIADC